MVLSIEWCASIVGYLEFVGKIVKVAKMNTVDEEKADTLVRKITVEAHGIWSNNKNDDLGNFTHVKAKQQISATLLGLSQC